MKGYRFYEELRKKNRKGEESRGTVVGLYLDNDNRPLYCSPHSGDWTMEAAVGVFDEPNSDVCSAQVSQKYLSEDCRRVSEKEARVIHPEMFRYLKEG